MSHPLPLASGRTISIRTVQRDDLPRIAEFAFTVSITEPLNTLPLLHNAHAATALWQRDAGAVAIVERQSSRLVGTAQYYRPGPCVHGLELGYIIHAIEDRGQGYAAQALRLLSDLLFAGADPYRRQQLMIEVWNTASWKVAERCGFLREGVMRASGLGEGEPADSFVYSRTHRDYLQELASNNGSHGTGGASLKNV